MNQECQQTSDLGWTFSNCNCARLNKIGDWIYLHLEINACSTLTVEIGYRGWCPDSSLYCWFHKWDSPYVIIFLLDPRSEHKSVGSCVSKQCNVCWWSLNSLIIGWHYINSGTLWSSTSWTREKQVVVIDIQVSCHSSWIKLYYEIGTRWSWVIKWNTNATGIYSIRISPLIHIYW